MSIPLGVHHRTGLSLGRMGILGCGTVAECPLQSNIIKLIRDFYEDTEPPDLDQGPLNRIKESLVRRSNQLMRQYRSAHTRKCGRELRLYSTKRSRVMYHYEVRVTPEMVSAGLQRARDLRSQMYSQFFAAVWSFIWKRSQAKAEQEFPVGTAAAGA